jgi:hypothetical protein
VYWDISGPSREVVGRAQKVHVQQRSNRVTHLCPSRVRIEVRKANLRRVPRRHSMY